MTAPIDEADRPVIETPDHSLTCEELAGDVFGFRAQTPAGCRAVAMSSDAAVVAAAFSSLEGWASEVHLVPPSLGSRVVPEDGFVLSTVSPRASVAPTGPTTHRTRWVVYTSGTTGEPKAIAHTLPSLSRTISTSRPTAPLTWGLLYDPTRMAGIQVILQALRSSARLVAPDPDAPLAARVGSLIAGGVNALSATPTIWRQILQLPAARSWPLRQITLGGEIADQRVLDALARAFPEARIVHVFASTETGAAFSVQDGRAGFPASYLDDAPRGIRLEIRDGILHVHSPDASAAGADGYASTGDVVEISGDRVVFRGRASGVVNIGGSNVWPEVVEAILRDHPDVVEAAVSPRPNPMTGHVLVAEVSLQEGADPESAPKLLRSWVRERAPRTHVPAAVTVTDAINISSTGKLER